MMFGDFFESHKTLKISLKTKNTHTAIRLYIFITFDFSHSFKLDPARTTNDKNTSKFFHIKSLDFFPHLNLTNKKTQTHSELINP